MQAADLLGAVEIGERACHAQDAMIAASGKPHGLGGVAQQRKSAARAISSSSGPFASAFVRSCGSPIAA